MDYQTMRDQSRSLSILAAWHGNNAIIESDTRPASVILVTCNFFSLYRLERAKLGRLLLPEECATPGGAPVAEISEELWRQRFASDPQIIGKAIRLNRHPYAIVGVVPEHFSGRPARPDPAVFAYLAGVTILSGCIAGLAPATESLRVDLVTALKGQEGTSTAKSRTRKVLIIAQVGMTFVLLAGAALFVRLQYDMTLIDPGFETRHVFLIDEQYPGPDVGPGVTPEAYRGSVASYFGTLNQRVRALPGVVSVAHAQATPFMRAETQEVRLQGQPKGNGRQASLDVVSANFFETLGVRIVHGRGFQSSDVTSESHLPPEQTDSESHPYVPVGVVSQAFARAFWPGQDPLGKVVEWGDPGTRIRIVGVARDTKSEEFGTLDGPRLYALMNYDFGGPLMIRFAGEPGPLASEIENAVQSVYAGQIVVPRTLRSLLEEDAKEIGALTEMILFLALLAIALSVIGIYAVVSFSMSQRTRELGIRMVLGATKGRIAASVLASGSGQIGIGLLVGLLLALPGSWALARLLKQGPFHTSVFDFAAFGMAAALLAAVALAAIYIPARRATNVDPMAALRYE